MQRGGSTWCVLLRPSSTALRSHHAAVHSLLPRGQCRVPPATTIPERAVLFKAVHGWFRTLASSVRTNERGGALRKLGTFQLGCSRRAPRVSRAGADDSINRNAANNSGSSLRGGGASNHQGLLVSRPSFDRRISSRSVCHVSEEDRRQGTNSSHAEAVWMEGARQTPDEGIGDDDVMNSIDKSLMGVEDAEAVLEGVVGEARGRGGHVRDGGGGEDTEDGRVVRRQRGAEEEGRGLRRGPRRSASGYGRRYFPKKGEELELYCESLAFKGKGVCRVEETGFVILCDRALPGERLIGRIVKKKKGMAEAVKVRTLVKHDNAVDAPCQHAIACGGCKTQNLAYHAQLAVKHEQVTELMNRIGKFGKSGDGGSSGNYMLPIVPCEKQFNYRNKMEFSFGTQVWYVDRPVQMMTEEESDAELSSSVDPGREVGPLEPRPRNFALGLHAPGRFDKILPIERCLLQHESANDVLQLVRAYCDSNRETLPAYDVVSHQGYLRQLMIRSGRDSKTGAVQLMVNIMTAEDSPDLLRPLAKQISSAHPEVVSVVNNVNDSLGSASVGTTEHVLHGGKIITEQLRGLDFEISANSFFQTNTSQAEVLYKMVEEACQLRGDRSEVLLDLFCGTGTIGLSMANRVQHVYGYELVPEAVEDARRNGDRNGITNATFIRGDLNKLKEDFGNSFPKPDIVITDPNRPGMHPKLLRFLSTCGASRIVYVSCNPSTCARDLDALCHGQEGSGDVGRYRLLSVQPVDMFPHTVHVECISILELKEED